MQWRRKVKISVPPGCMINVWMEISMTTKDVTQAVRLVKPLAVEIRRVRTHSIPINHFSTPDLETEATASCTTD
jgi:hypothetical protein